MLFRSSSRPLTTQPRTPLFQGFQAVVEEWAKGLTLADTAGDGETAEDRLRTEDDTSLEEERLNVQVTRVMKYAMVLLMPFGASEAQTASLTEGVRRMDLSINMFKIALQKANAVDTLKSLKPFWVPHRQKLEFDAVLANVGAAEITRLIQEIERAQDVTVLLETFILQNGMSGTDDGERVLDICREEQANSPTARRP